MNVLTYRAKKALHEIIFALFLPFGDWILILDFSGIFKSQCKISIHQIFLIHFKS